MLYMILCQRNIGQNLEIIEVDVRIVKIYENNIPQFLQVNNLEGESELTRVGRVVLKKGRGRGKGLTDVYGPSTGMVY